MILTFLTNHTVFSSFFYRLPFFPLKKMLIILGQWINNRRTVLPPKWRKRGWMLEEKKKMRKREKLCEKSTSCTSSV